MNKVKNKAGKGFFASHAKSSAFLISVIVHAIILVVAISFVAVTVYVKKEVETFEGKTIKKPRLALQKLKVPVKANKKKPPKPRLTKRLVVNVNRNMQNFKMPEVSGIKMGTDSIGDDGLGGVSDIGFSMPEIKLFGVKSKGEKVFIILDASQEMMRDEVGGIAAYTIIKNELERILNTLPPTALFNLSVHDVGSAHVLFPALSMASAANLNKVEGWLEPLNAVKPGMGYGDWGCGTLGDGGIEIYENLLAGKIEDPTRWYRSLMIAMKQQADSVFILTSDWGTNQRHSLGGSNNEWFNSSAGHRWKKAYKEGLKLLEEENRKRAADGKPPRVLSKNEWAIAGAYFPDIERPPEIEWYNYTSRDFATAMLEIRKKHKKDQYELERGSKFDFSINVIHFREAGGGGWMDGRTEDNFSELTALCKGEYRTIAGLGAIQSYVSSEGVNLDPDTP